jgi:hypothetical protein
MTEDEFKSKLNEVADAIAIGVKAIWQDVRNSFPEHSFFVFVLSTFDSEPYVSASANSLQNHQKICEVNDLEPGTPDEEYYRWSVDEWGELGYFGLQEEFDHAIALLAEIYDAAEDDEWDPYREGIIQAAVDGLGRASAAGVFGRDEDRAGITLFVTTYDGFDIERIEDESARMLNSASVYEQFSIRYAATEKQKQDENNAQQARYDALSKLSPNQQADHCLKNFIDHLLNPLGEIMDQFEREQQILDLMVRIGDPIVLPIIASLADGIDTPIGNEGYALMKVIRGIGPEIDDELHRKLATLLIQYCEYNIGRSKWQVTPFHIAKFLYDQFADVYPHPSMEGNNALGDNERFLEIARRHVV